MRFCLIKVNSFHAAPDIVGMCAIIIHLTPLSSISSPDGYYHITPIPVMRLAEGDEVSSLYPANEPNSKNGVSGSNNKATRSRASISRKHMRRRYQATILYPYVFLHNDLHPAKHTTLILADTLL